MSALRKVLFIGDADSAAKFIGTFLDGDEQKKFAEYRGKQSDIRLTSVSSAPFSEAGGEGTLRLVSESFPFGIEARFENSFELSSDTDCDTVVFICDFPWNTADFLIAVNKFCTAAIKEKTLSRISCIVLCRHDEIEKTGATDLVRENSAADDMKLAFEEHFPLIENMLAYADFRRPHDLVKSLFFHRNSLGTAGAEALRRFRSWKTWLDNEFSMPETFWQMYGVSFEDITDNQTMRDKVTGFECVKKSPDIVRSYYANFSREFMVDILVAADSVYSELISKVCFWDKENDTAKLNTLIQNAYDALYIAKNPIQCPDSESGYRDIINTNIDVRFKETIADFLENGLIEIIRSHIERKVAAIL